MYLSKTPSVVKPLAKDFLWKVDTSRKVLFLTFDDGPTPEITERALMLLREYNALGTFFCVGNNVSKHPEIYSRIVRNGHQVGNHTNKHENGWKTTNIDYFRSYLTCQKKVNSPLFRPPYGKITRSQAKEIGKRSKIVMWDVLSGDFDEKSDKEKCLKRVVKHAEPGSIVVFHDSKKAGDKMLYCLKGTLDHFSEQGYVFRSLNSDYY